MRKDTFNKLVAIRNRTFLLSNAPGSRGPTNWELLNMLDDLVEALIIEAQKTDSGAPTDVILCWTMPETKLPQTYVVVHCIVKDREGTVEASYEGDGVWKEWIDGKSPEILTSPVIWWIYWPIARAG